MNTKLATKTIPPGKQQPPVEEPPGRDNPNIPPGHSEPVPVKEPETHDRKERK